MFEKTNGCRRSYSEYVNHMIRFFLKTTDGLTVDGHTQADVTNWLAVQAVWCELTADEQALIREMYTSNRRYEDTVQEYAHSRGVNPKSIWKRLTDITFQIARLRGLV